MEEVEGAEMTEDEKYVQDMWDRAEVCESVTGPYLKWSISVGGRGFTRACIPDNWARSEAEAWSAAAEFTRTRLQQIRDVEEELDSIAEWQNWQLGNGYGGTQYMLPIKRILAREQAALADLKRGLRVAEERTER